MKQKVQKGVSYKKNKIKFGDYENCLEGTQLENKTKNMEEIRITQIVSKIYTGFIKTIN